MSTTTGEAPIRAAVIEDSAAERSKVVGLLQADGDILVTGEASGGRDGIALVCRSRPDVVVLDLHLPDGSSLGAIEQIMARAPTPILLLSWRSDGPASRVVVDALVAGALDALPQPPEWTSEGGIELRQTVRQLRKVTVVRHPRGVLERPKSKATAPRRDVPVVAVAASTGGPQALATLLAGLDGLEAPVLVVQHLHHDFTPGLVEWMDRASTLSVEIARDGQRARPGRVYIAPGATHLRLGPDRTLNLDPNPATTHRPSADQLFHSVAEHGGAAGIGVVLTGMGDDGARGLLAIQLRGGHTLAQDEASSAVFGMPKAAYKLGAVRELLPLEKLAPAVIRAARKVGKP